MESLPARQDHNGHPYGGVCIPLAQNSEHPLTTRNARFHRLEVDPQWCILHPLGIPHPIPREFQTIPDGANLESALGEQMQAHRLNSHTE